MLVTRIAEALERIANALENNSNVSQMNNKQLPSQNSCINMGQQKKQLIANRIQTPDGTILWSRFTHDFVPYKDSISEETYFIDGGNDYMRTSVNQQPAKNLSVYDDEPWEVQRKYCLWGSRGMWIPVCCLSNDHIEAIIDDGYRNTGVQKEYEYRKQNNIVIPEHDYEDEQVYAITPKEN